MAIYDPKSRVAEEFINDQEIRDTLAYAEEHKSDVPLLMSILDKAAQFKGLTHREAAVLLACDVKEVNDRIFETAIKVKEHIYGSRIVLFAPLYLSNYCVNTCTYCPYHAKNKSIVRKKLTQEEIRNEVIALQDLGHKRLHVNIAATTVENYRKLHEAEIGTYQLFQETYNRKAYEELHPKGPKSDYAYHTEAHDRAMEGGIDDVGLGVLFGLDLCRYDFVGLLMHAEHLEAVWGVGPHTISVPRICPADDIDPASFENAVPDDLFLKIVALIRMAVPYTGMIMSTREGQRIRTEALKLGISQISGGSRTSVGGYAIRSVQEMEEKTEQFETNDRRSLDEIVRWLLENHYLPSFCTACYRAGRTGDRFMEWAKDGSIATYCQANAIMTMKEYMCDYASKETREAGERVIANELPKIPHEKIRIASEKRLIRIADGERDFRF